MKYVILINLSYLFLIEIKWKDHRKHAFFYLTCKNFAFKRVGLVGHFKVKLSMVGLQKAKL